MVRVWARPNVAGDDSANGTVYEVLLTNLVNEAVTAITAVVMAEWGGGVLHSVPTR